MTTLEAVESTESLAAVAYLLNLVMKRYVMPIHITSLMKVELCIEKVILQDPNKNIAAGSLLTWRGTCSVQHIGFNTNSLLSCFAVAYVLEKIFTNIKHWCNWS